MNTGSRSADVTYSNDGSIVVEYPSGLAVTLETGTAPSLSGEQVPSALKRKIISSKDGPVHRLEWRYYIRRQRPQRTGRKLRVRPDSSTALHEYNSKTLMVSSLGTKLVNSRVLEWLMHITRSKMAHNHNVIFNLKVFTPYIMKLELIPL